MRVLAIAVLILLYPLSASPQQPGSVISGQILGPENTPLSSVLVSLRTPGDTASVARTLSSAAGAFILQGIPPRTYELVAELFGYRTAIVELTVPSTGDRVAVPPLVLETAPVQLEEISATASRSPVVMEIDRTVYDTREMPAVAGGSAADVLRQIDELEVSVAGDVRLRGDRTVAIQINGRPTPMQGDQLADFLQQMPANSIASVEVIPNPSVRDDAEGMTGIVNIVLQRDSPLGVSGSAGISGSTRGARTLNGRLAVQKGSFTLFAGGSGTLSAMEMDLYELREDLSVDPPSYHEREGSGDNQNTLAFGDFSAEYMLREGTTAWANGYASFHDHDMRQAAENRWYNGLDDMTEQHVVNARFENGHSFVDVGAGVKHEFETKNHELTMDLRHTNSPQGIDTRSRTHPFQEPDVLLEERTTIVDGANRSLVLRADYVRPVAEGQIEAGLAVANRLSSSSFSDSHSPEDAVQSTEPQEFRHEEGIATGYVNARYKAGPLGLQGGGRIERVETRIGPGGEPEENNTAWFLVPSVAVSWQVDPLRTLRLTYSQRRGRPHTNMLNPSRPTINPLSRFEGNTELAPNRTDALTLDGSRTGSVGSLRVSAFINRTVDHWDMVRRQEDGVIVSRFENIAEVRQVGSTITASRPSRGRMSGSLNVGVFHRRMDASNVIPGQVHSSWNWSAGGRASIRTVARGSITGNLNFIAPRDLPQGRTRGMINSSIGARQQFMSGRATLNLFVNDPLGVHRFGMSATGPGFTQVIRNAPRARAATLSLTVNLGSMPEQQSRRNTEDEPGA